MTYIACTVANPHCQLSLSLDRPRFPTRGRFGGAGSGFRDQIRFPGPAVSCVSCVLFVCVCVRVCVCACFLRAPPIPSHRPPLPPPISSHPHTHAHAHAHTQAPAPATIVTYHLPSTTRSPSPDFLSYPRGRQPFPFLCRRCRGFGRSPKYSIGVWRSQLTPDAPFDGWPGPVLIRPAILIFPKQQL